MKVSELLIENSLYTTQILHFDTDKEHRFLMGPILRFVMLSTQILFLSENTSLT